MRSFEQIYCRRRQGDVFDIPLLLLAVENGPSANPAINGTLGLLARSEQANVSQQRQVIDLFRSARTPLYRYFVSIGLQPDQADDVIQEAFIRLYEHLASGAKIENPRGWLFSVAHNL